MPYKPKVDNTTEHTRKPSTSSSDYSDDSNADSTRRIQKSSTDRRRVAIMQIDSLRTRRGHDSHLALVAPPDAAQQNFTHLTPPSTSQFTPEIGQAKDIHIPVAGPIVLNLGSPSPSSSSTSSPFLHYKPGLHSVAGPLPPPPRANFNIDIHSTPPPRPPRLQSPTSMRTKRDLDAVKQALQLPPSVTAVLSSKSSNLTTTNSLKEVLHNDSSDLDSKSVSKPSSDISTTSSMHRREGAFSPLEDTPADPPSESITTMPLKISNMEIKEATPKVSDDAADIPPITIVRPSSRSNTLPAEIDHHRFSEWLKSNPELSQPRQRDSSADETHHKQQFSESPERSMSPDPGGSDGPSPPPKSFRNSLKMNLKRLSLPRTASLSSKSGRRWSGGGTHYSSRTPSPSAHDPFLPRVQKIRSTNPAALFCHEVHSQRTTSERCFIYATKINELYFYDCGLSEWVANMKSRGPNTQHRRAPPTQPFAPQPRHTSRSSMISEATFPRRPDASTATDLSQGAYGDITPTAVSLNLPYPSLAMNPPRANPSRSNSSVGTPPSSIRSLTPATSISKGGGFFSSLGRKTSVSKKEKLNNINIPSPSGSLPSASGTGRLLSASSQHTAPSSRNMNISRPIMNPPSVPGGPRAPPRRTQRSNTSFTPSFPPALATVNNDLGRRPSMFDLSLDPIIDIRADPEFYQQVDKLANLLPQANRDVLAGYLRRAGQDMLAIGQYLEDEKNGTIRLYD